MVSSTVVAFPSTSNRLFPTMIMENDETSISSQMEPIDLLIISPAVFIPHLRALQDHKNNTGISTRIIDIQYIYNQESAKGRDEAETLKYFLNEAKETWNISYVLLVGGRKNQGKTEEWWIPVRYSSLERNYGSWEETRFLTDLYFADLYDESGDFSSWDQNQNGKYGEWPKQEEAVDIPDLYPDISVGRLPCRTLFDVKIAVKKIITYETGDFSSDWFKNMVVIAGDTYPGKTPGFIDGEVHTQQALDYMTDFNPVKRWVSDGSLRNWIDVITAINAGCGFVFFSGHGGPHLWATYPVENGDRWGASFHLRHMPFLFNSQNLPLCVSASGCFNNMFNVSLGHSEWVYVHPFGIPLSLNIARCWGETLTLHPYGGCIAVIASTAFSYESSDVDSERGGCEWLDIHFFEQYQLQEEKILGDCWQATVHSFLQHFPVDWSDTSKTGDALIIKNLQQWLLLGDPSLRIGGI